MDEPSATSAASPSATGDPQAQAALAAYAKYLSTFNEAERHPLPAGSTYPSEADFGAVTFDPLHGQVLADLDLMVKSGTVFRGTPPQSHPRVTSVDRETTADRPWPTVTLTDCPSGINGWVEISAESGTPVQVVKQDIPPPYLTTITVIYFEKHWGVRTTKLDLRRTCTPSS